jgi:hypothetical protein
MDLKFNKLIIALFFCAIAFCDTVFSQPNYQNITKYEVYYGWARHYPVDWLAIRRFENDGKGYYLLVNPQTLETKIDDQTFYAVKPLTLAEARDFFKNTPYEKALRKAENQSVNIQDAGIEMGMPKETGISIFLPSLKKWNARCP